VNQIRDSTKANREVMITVVAMLACIGFPIIVARPEYGVYIILLANPLIVGIARGQLGSVLRPNEFLLAFVLIAICVRGVLLVRRQRRSYVSYDRLDTALLFLVAAGSVLPVLWRYARGLTLSEDDLLYAVVLLKYYALFRLFRSAIITTTQVERCLVLSLVSALIVAVIGVLQVSDLFGIPEFLLAYYDQPFEGHTTVMNERATSTVASAFGVADMMTMNIIIALALRQTTRRSGLLLLITIILLAGCIAAGEFSGYVGLAAALFAFGFISGRFDQLLPIGIAGGGLAALLLRPVLALRLEGFQGQAGVPDSWAGRWGNLQTYIFPDLFTHGNWVLGVRPAPRIPALETWRDWVYIESGYIWLLWIGGIPFVAAFVFFAIVSLKTLQCVARERTDAVGVAAKSAFSYLVAIIVMMFFDPHFTLRGSADLFFPLLALSLADSRAGARGSCFADIGPGAVEPAALVRNSS
jgi:hypothetical protein